MGFSVELTTVSRFSQPNFPNVLQKVSLLFLLGSSLTLLEPQSRFGDKPKRDCGSKRANRGPTLYGCSSMFLRPSFEKAFSCRHDRAVGQAGGQDKRDLD